MRAREKPVRARQQRIARRQVGGELLVGGDGVLPSSAREFLRGGSVERLVRREFRQLEVGVASRRKQEERGDQRPSGRDHSVERYPREGMGFEISTRKIHRLSPSAHVRR